MATEIERKFLVLDDSWRNEVISETRYQQGYLANQENASVRVRIGGGRAYLNIKSATIGASRHEFEYEVPLADAEQMLEHVVSGPCIDKVRYEVRHGDHLWEIDVFHGDNEGLIVAEVELGSEDEAFAKPDWAGDEVTGDPKYYNAMLVRHPFNQW